MKLDGSQKFGISLGSLTLAIVLIGLAVMSMGCATRGDVAGLRGDLAMLDKFATAEAAARKAEAAKFEGLLTGLGVRIDAVGAKQLTPEQVAAIMRTTIGGLATQVTVDELKKLFEEQAREAREANANLNTGFNALGREVEGARTGLAALGAAIGEVRPDPKSGKSKSLVERVDSVGARVAAITTGMQSLGRRLARLQHAGGGEVVQINFPAAKLAADGSFAACAEISPAARKYLDRAVVAKLDGGKYEVDGSIVGFANAVPFVDVKGKTLANSDELNGKCAEARAKAVADYLKSATKTKVEVPSEGGGITTRFSLPGVGDVSADRSAVVVLKRRGTAGTPPATTPPAAASTGKLTFDLDWNAADEAAAKALAAKLTSAGFKAEAKLSGTQWFVQHTLAANSDKEATAASITIDKVAGVDSSVGKVTWWILLQNREFAEADKVKANDLVAKLKAAGVEAVVSERSAGTPPVKVFRVHLERFDVEAEAIAAKAKIDALGLNNPTTIERQ